LLTMESTLISHKGKQTIESSEKKSKILLFYTSPCVKPYMSICLQGKTRRNHAQFPRKQSMSSSSPRFRPYSYHEYTYEYFKINSCILFCYLTFNDLAPYTVFDSFSHPFLPYQCLFTLSK
jgi:hypothetical protein